MKILRYILLLASLVLLAACGGPLYGQSLKLSEGLKSYEVIKGDITELKRVKTLLVVGPFLGTSEEHHMCIPKEEGTFPFTSDIIFISKHNDAQRFAAGLEKAGLFDTELHLEVYYDRIEETTKRLRAMSSQEMQNEFKLKKLPEMVLFGVVKKIEHKIAPMRGIIIDVEYELEFYNPDSRQSIVIDVAVFEIFNEDMNTIIRETKNRMAGGR